MRSIAAIFTTSYAAPPIVSRGVPSRPDVVRPLPATHVAPKTGGSQTRVEVSPWPRRCIGWYPVSDRGGVPWGPVDHTGMRPSVAAPYDIRLQQLVTRAARLGPEQCERDDGNTVGSAVGLGPGGEDGGVDQVVSELPAEPTQVADVTVTDGP